MNHLQETTIIIDGKKIENKEVFHCFLKHALDLPDYYGMNLDALWDCITGHIALPVVIIWKNFEISQKKLGTKFVSEVISLLNDAKKNLGPRFDYKLD